jgi:hypothetical protein
MKSDWANNSSNVTNDTPARRHQDSSPTGSNATTRMANPIARTATSRPIRPNPITPKVLPVISVPTNFARSHLPAWVDASAWGVLRARANNSAKVCSAAEMVLPPGTLATTIPWRDAAPKSMLSTPVPARPINEAFWPPPSPRPSLSFRTEPSTRRSRPLLSKGPPFQAGFQFNGNVFVLLKEG